MDGGSVRFPSIYMLANWQEQGNSKCNQCQQNFGSAAKWLEGTNEEENTQTHQDLSSHHWLNLPSGRIQYGRINGKSKKKSLIQLLTSENFVKQKELTGHSDRPTNSWQQPTAPTTAWSDGIQIWRRIPGWWTAKGDRATAHNSPWYNGRECSAWGNKEFLLINKMIYLVGVKLPKLFSINVMLTPVPAP
jgi:hypothetical protein